MSLLRPGPRAPAPLVAVVTLALLVSGCVGVGEYRVGPEVTESRTVDAGGVDVVHATLAMRAGDLAVAGGADTLLAGAFTFNVPEFRPDVAYATAGRTGTLRVAQPDGGVRVVDLPSVRYAWDVRLGDHVPMHLNVSLGAGTGNLTLGSLRLTELEVEAGAGDMRVDLRGSRALTALTVASGTGDTTVDLRGAWLQDLAADLETGVGETTILLPADAGVHVTTDTGVGMVRADGLARQGDTYVNPAYGEAPVTITIHVSAGVGAVNLLVEG